MTTFNLQNRLFQARSNVLVLLFSIVFSGLFSSSMAYSQSPSPFFLGFIPFSAAQTFPIQDRIFLSGQYIDEIFILNDGSMWVIKGVSDNYRVGSGEKHLTIYSGADALPQPNSGVRSDYFMLVEGNSTTYFVEPLPNLAILIQDQIIFSGQYIDEIFILTDGSMWVIKGVSDNYRVGSGEKDLTIYAGADALPQPDSGVRSDYFMLAEDNSTTYFVEPLPDLAILIQDQIIFSGQYIDEIFILTDGSMWVIKGVSDNYRVGSGEKKLRIYAGADALPEPDSGVRSDYFMLVEGNSTTYFVQALLNETLDVLIDGVSLGSVTSTPSGIDCGNDCSHVFPSGSRIALTASAAIDSTFAGWSGDCTGTSPTCELSMSQARSVTARFEEAQSNENLQILALTVVGPRSVLVNPTGSGCDGICVSQFNIGSQLTLTAVAPAGSTFAGWGGACESAGMATSCQLTMNQAQAVTASFEVVTPAGSQSLNLNTVGSGRVTSAPIGIDCGSDCSANYTTGTKIVLTAKPESGAKFIEWGGDCSGVEMMCVLDMTKASKVVAIFDGSTVNRTSLAWQVTEIYIATLGYAPDKQGLQYWVQQMESNPDWNPTTVAQSFFDQPLVQAMYPETEGYGPFIDALYRNLFGRTPDTQGYNYWLNALESGQVSRNQMIIALINGGWGNADPEAKADMARFANRVGVGLAFADEQSRNGTQYDNLSATGQAYLRAIGHHLLLCVTSDVTTRDKAIASIPGLLSSVH